MLTLILPENSDIAAFASVSQLRVFSFGNLGSQCAFNLNYIEHLSVHVAPPIGLCVVLGVMYLCFFVFDPPCCRQNRFRANTRALSELQRGSIAAPAKSTDAAAAAVEPPVPAPVRAPSVETRAAKSRSWRTRTRGSVIDLSKFNCALFVDSVKANLRSIEFDPRPLFRSPQKLRWRMTNAAYTVLTLGFVSICEACLMLLDCETIGDRLVLVSARYVTCWQGTHTIWASLAIAVLALLCIFLPLFLVVRLKSLKAQFSDPSDPDNPVWLAGEAVKESHGVLVLCYKPGERLQS